MKPEIGGSGAAAPAPAAAFGDPADVVEDALDVGVIVAP